MLKWADFILGMKYTKPPLSFEQQATLLLQRGFQANHSDLVNLLSQINYYRLSGYLYQFRTSDSDDNFVSGTTIDKVQARYKFDRELRLLIFDGIEKLEISILRSQLVELFASKYGTFGFLNRRSFKPTKTYPADFHTKLVNNSKSTLEKNSSDFVAQYREKYSSEEHLPCWMLFETMTFGALSTFYSNMHPTDREAIAIRFGQPENVFQSWLAGLNFARNLCAHHGRIWNRYVSMQVKIPKAKTSSGFHSPITVTNQTKRIFPTLVVVQYLLNYVQRDNQWGTTLSALLLKYSELPFEEIGFPENWIDVPFWQ